MHIMLKTQRLDAGDTSAAYFPHKKINLKKPYTLGNKTKTTVKCCNKLKN